MDVRTFGPSGTSISCVGLGTWQLGADWGDVDSAEAQAILEAAAESGVTFFDTADVYGDGRSEQAIGAFMKANPGWGGMVATKMGRRMEQVPENYVMSNFRAWTDRSRRNLGVDSLDLVQLHCPPSSVCSDSAVFDALSTLVEEGAISAYGVSVETCDEALAALKQPGLFSIQIILNAFRQKPLDEVLPAAAAAGVGIIARVPLASGLLTGKFTHNTTFAASDHRNYNRDGSAFDVGETFSGVPYADGLHAAADFVDLVKALPFDVTPAQAAIAWIVAQAGVSTVIPGASSPKQAVANAAAGSLPALPESFLTGVRDLYDEYFRATIHPRW